MARSQIVLNKDKIALFLISENESVCNIIFISKFILGKLIATVWFRDLVQEEEQLMEEKKKKKDDKKKKEAAQKKVVYDKLC